VVVFTDRIVFYEDETRTSVKDRWACVMRDLCRVTALFSPASSITSMDVTGVALLPQPPASAMQIAAG
jgi:hypothetical protein